MNDKKKGLFGGLFKTSGGCNCGVKIIEEKPEKKKDKTTSNNKNKK